MAVYCFLSSFVHATLLLSFPPILRFAACFWTSEKPQNLKVSRWGQSVTPSLSPSRTRSSSLSDAPRFPLLLGAVKTAAINRDLLQELGGEGADSGEGARGRREEEWRQLVDIWNDKYPSFLRTDGADIDFLLRFNQSQFKAIFFPQRNIPQFARRLSFIKAYWINIMWQMKLD